MCEVAQITLGSPNGSMFIFHILLGINMIGSTNGIVQWLLTKTAFRRLASFDPSIARP
jgi:hypothetical protein